MTSPVKLSEMPPLLSVPRNREDIRKIMFAAAEGALGTVADDDGYSVTQRIEATLRLYAWPGPVPWPVTVENFIHDSATINTTEEFSEWFHSLPLDAGDDDQEFAQRMRDRRGDCPPDVRVARGGLKKWLEDTRE